MSTTETPAEGTATTPSEQDVGDGDLTHGERRAPRAAPLGDHRQAVVTVPVDADGRPDPSPGAVVPLVVALLVSTFEQISPCQHRAGWPATLAEIAATAQPSALVGFLQEARTDLEGGCYCWHGPTEQVAAHCVTASISVVERARQLSASRRHGPHAEGRLSEGETRYQDAVTTAANTVAGIGRSLGVWAR